MGERIFNVDGELVPESEATVSVRDRGFMYGDAAFETLRAYSGTIFEWEAHADRLERTCRGLSLDHGLNRETLRERIEATLKANEYTEAYVKLSISRGVQPGTLTPADDVNPTVVVYIAKLNRGGTAGNPVWDTPARLESVPIQGVPDEAIPAGAKTHSYLNNVLARTHLSPDADEALLTDDAGRLLEGAASNLFFVSDDILKTPAENLDLLPGITRSVVLDLATTEGIQTETGAYTVADLEAARGGFLTNSIWEIRPIKAFDDVSFDGNPIIDRLRSAFNEYVESACY